LTESIDLTAGDIKTFNIQSGSDVNLILDDNVTITCESNAFLVNNGSLKLSGNGKIIGTSKQTKGVISVSGSDAIVTIDGITIDVTTEGKDSNYAYGIYSSNGSTVNFKSGVIKTAFGSCISTNNTTGGGNINVSGGELYSDGSYAIYNPAYGIINITGGKVQGINARMGEINVSNNAEIIATTITSETYDDIGNNISTSGCIWFGDTVALVAGTYTDDKGVDIKLSISDNAKVNSEFRSAIGIYMVDTKTKASVDVNVSNGNNVTTSDAEFSAIKVYDHDYINAAAVAAGKTYSPVVTSDVTVTVDGSVIYPEQ